MSPLNSGQRAASAPIGPCLVDCPTANSIYSKGIPHKTNMMRYGSKNAPGEKIRIADQTINYMRNKSFSTCDLNLVNFNIKASLFENFCYETGFSSIH